jgi:hypothetical protein
MQRYSKSAGELKAPAICVIEHASFSRLVPLNRELSIRTIACPQNLEALDTAASFQQNNPKARYATAIDFADELTALSLCDDRLLISRIETGVVAGLGIPSRYYPYIPVGEISKGLLEIREVRSRSEIETGLFLMLGSGSHTTTWQAFSWFVTQAHREGLPPGAKVIVVGLRTDELLPPQVAVPGLELRGWLHQAELDSLLLRVQAILIPQQLGFGALTRLPESSCAGIPTIVSEHSTRAIDPPPGIVTVADEWPAWYSSMEKMMDQPTQITLENYQAWERHQAHTLRASIERLMNRPYA